MTADGVTRKDTPDGGASRLDRWLWAARFFKTRSLAAEAVAGGLVHLNDQRAKPAKPVRIGDIVSIQRHAVATVVVVRGLSDQRRPAPEAMLLYEETVESAAARARYVAERRVAAASRIERTGRPTKHDRRTSIRLRRGDG